MVCTLEVCFSRAVAQAVRHQLHTAVARVRAQVSLCGLCNGQSGCGAGFSSSSSVFTCHYDLPLRHVVMRGMDDESVGSRSCTGT
jgi:hypothetical protein